MRIILIGNYPLDRQESMNRFVKLLFSGCINAGLKCEIWRPKVFFGAVVKSTTSGLGKWLGYLDKWILFPLLLKWRLLDKRLKRKDVYFHICDHSNAPYLGPLPTEQTIITCHDVLAIRGALGYRDAYCPSSRFGVILQKWILRNLQQAERLASVSQCTLNQLLELSVSSSTNQREWRVIHNGFNANFKRLETNKVNELLTEIGFDPEIPFILHVGSDLERKNRKLLLDMVAILGNRWSGYICFAGEAIDKNLMAHAASLGLQNRIISILMPAHSILEALYNACETFIFPSFSEGFGWPVIEAQACGTPVIASNIQPMHEVCGGAALYADPTKPQDFADAFLSLKNIEKREKLILMGFENAKRFKPSRMISDYIKLYGVTPAKLNTPCCSN